MKIIKDIYKAIIRKSLYEYKTGKTGAINGVRVCYFALENYRKTKSNLWASALSYYSLLSIVPLLAIAFSVAKFVGVDEYAKENIINNSPLPPEVLDRLIGFSEKLLSTTREGVMAGIGFLFLGWSIIKIFSLIEKSFNDIWGVKEGRGIVRKITDYFAIILLFPIGILISNGILSLIQVYLLKQATVFQILLKVSPYLIMITFFTFMYMIIPNTKVKVTNALVAGVFTTVFYLLVQFIFFRSQVIILNYNKIYGSFTIIPIFIIWQKTIWFIIVLGAHLSFVLQNSYKYGYTLGKGQMSIKSKREALFGITYLLIKNYQSEEDALTIEKLSKKLEISMSEIGDLIEVLLEVEIVYELATQKEERYFKINKNINKLTIGSFLEAIEEHGYERGPENTKLVEVIEVLKKDLSKGNLERLIKDI